MGYSSFVERNGAHEKPQTERNTKMTNQKPTTYIKHSCGHYEKHERTLIAAMKAAFLRKCPCRECYEKQLGYKLEF